MSKKPSDVSATSKERNEYIPSFIAKKPFYVADDDSSAPAGSSDYLEHQRLQSTSAAEQRWYDRGRKVGPAATKFRKGACENCGAMTHKTKECLSRKRKLGARWTGRDIQADEVVQNVNLGWDAKRDRWNGYDARAYDGVVEEFNTLEEMKRKRVEHETTRKDGDGEEGVDADLKYDEETDMGRQQSTSTRNLRLREDTAKYLLNLDLDSAKYDPKTRSMVDSGAMADQAAALTAEEGFMRASGDAAEFERAQRYAWESSEREDGKRIHLQANPTAGEILRKKEIEELELKREAQKKDLLEKYGGQHHLQSNPIKEAGVAESDRYVEYDARGKIKGAPVTKIKSKYLEDVLINNHTSVWGSWWKDFKWGYACCHSIVKNSYCTGEDGRRALEAAEKQRTGAALDENPAQITWRENVAPASGTLDDGAEQSVEVVAANSKYPQKDTKDIRDGVAEREMEEFRRKRITTGDPMANLLGRDELVH